VSDAETRQLVIQVIATVAAAVVLQIPLRRIGRTVGDLADRTIKSRRLRRLARHPFTWAAVLVALAGGVLYLVLGALSWTAAGYLLVFGMVVYVRTELQQLRDRLHEIGLVLSAPFKTGPPMTPEDEAHFQAEVDKHANRLRKFREERGR
jgi:hypothetical protein